jgi:CheY-like chemotaxis protein
VAEQAQRDRKHVFVVDGAPDVLDLVRDLLQGEGYDVTATNYVPTTFSQVAALQPDAVVLDLAVGERDGWELLDRLDAEAAMADTPVLVVSSDPALLEAAADRAACSGARAYLAKSFDLGAMLTAIGGLIGGA